MRHQCTVFNQLLKAVPRTWFARAAKEHGVGRQKRKLTPWGHVVTMVAAQLSGSRSLRDLERMIDRQPGSLPHLGLGRVARSTLSDANATRPAALFEAVAAKLCEASAGGKRGTEALRLIDATRMVAGKRVEAWAKGGVKLHLCLDPVAQRPTWFQVTRDRVNDITAAQKMPIEPGVTYVFDKGYYDFAFWAALHADNCRFVTRLKANSPTREVKERKAKGEGILFDRTARLSERMTAQRRNPFQDRVRLVGVKIDNGRELTLLTNDLEASAVEIAALYKARWQVELYFKWIKQNLKLGHFLGASENALKIQIMAALIAYMLLRIATRNIAADIGLQACARLMPTLLFARRQLEAIFTNAQAPPSQPCDGDQLAFAYA